MTTNTWADMITESTVNVEKKDDKDQPPRFDFYKEKYGESDYVLMFWNPHQALEQWMIKDLLEGIDVKARGIRVGKTGKCYADFENEETLERVKELDGEIVGDVVITVSPVPKRTDPPVRDFNKKNEQQQRGGMSQGQKTRGGRNNYQNQSYREKKEQMEREGQPQRQQQHRQPEELQKVQQDKEKPIMLNDTEKKGHDEKVVPLKAAEQPQEQRENSGYQQKRYNNNYRGNNGHRNNGYNQRGGYKKDYGYQQKRQEKEPAVEELKPEESKEPKVLMLNDLNEVRKGKDSYDRDDHRGGHRGRGGYTHRGGHRDNDSYEGKRENSRGSYGKGRGGHTQTERPQMPQNPKAEKKEEVISLDKQQEKKKEEVAPVPEDQKSATFTSRNPRQFGEARGRGNRVYTRGRGQYQNHQQRQQTGQKWDENDMPMFGGHATAEYEVKKDEATNNITIEKKVSEESSSDEEEWQTQKKSKDTKKKRGGKKGGK